MLKCIDNAAVVNPPPAPRRDRAAGRRWNRNMPKPQGDKRLLEMPGHLIRRLHQISFALFLNEAKAFGVTPVQYAALVAIHSHPGIDQTTLCNIIAFDRTTMGDVVGRLQRKKLINRVNGARDRRTKALTITKAGQRLIREIEPAVLSTQRLILAPLPAAKRDAFMTMLRHLVHLNNSHSRAPLRGKRVRRGPSFRSRAKRGTRNP
jgi:DNA-binding MarR family transcriptional regulator